MRLKARRAPINPPATTDAVHVPHEARVRAQVTRKLALSRAARKVKKDLEVVLEAPKAPKTAMRVVAVLANAVLALVRPMRWVRAGPSPIR